MVLSSLGVLFAMGFKFILSKKYDAKLSESKALVVVLKKQTSDSSKLWGRFNHGVWSLWGEPTVVETVWHENSPKTSPKLFQNGTKTDKQQLSKQISKSLDVSQNLNQTAVYKRLTNCEQKAQLTVSRHPKDGRTRGARLTAFSGESEAPSAGTPSKDVTEVMKRMFFHVLNQLYTFANLFWEQIVFWFEFVFSQFANWVVARCCPVDLELLWAQQRKVFCAWTLRQQIPIGMYIFI